MKKLSFAIVAAMIACMMHSCDTRKPFRSAEGMVWNTLYHITYASNVSLDDSIHAVMKRVEMSLSAFNDSSVVSRVNRNERVVVDSMFRKVFLESQRVSRVSGGAFDPAYRGAGRQCDAACGHRGLPYRLGRMCCEEITVDND